jgi:hypothetical protein
MCNADHLFTKFHQITVQEFHQHFMYFQAAYQNNASYIKAGQHFYL